MDVLHACAELLIEKERINRKEFEALFGEKPVYEETEEENEMPLIAGEGDDSVIDFQNDGKEDGYSGTEEMEGDESEDDE